MQIDRLSFGNPGDTKPAGEGISELRIDYGPDYRVYFVRRGETVIVLLARSDKRTQAQDIDMTLRARANSLAGSDDRDETIPWKTEDHLETAEDIAAYLEAVFDAGDPELIGYALGTVSRSKGMTEIARRTGLGRQSLYKALSPEGRPEFATVLKVVRALGLKLTVTAA